MAKFVSPLQRFWRSTISYANFSKSFSTTASANAYRAAFCTKLGKPLEIKNVTENKPLGKNEVRIRIRAAAVNFADILMCQGGYQERPELPFIPGREYAGDIIEIGSQVKAFKEGDRVLSLAPGEAFAEQCVIEAINVWKLPDHVDYVTASVLPITYGSAYIGLTRKVGLKKGETLLVTGAAGGTGLAAIDLGANVFGANVIGAAGSPEKIALAKSTGASHVFNYREEELKSQVLAATGKKGANVIFDTVGGDTLLNSLRCIAFEGRLLTIGFASGSIPKIPANILLIKNISAVGLYLAAYRLRNPQLFYDNGKAVLQLFSEGKIRPYISKVLPLDKVNESFQIIQGRKSIGKIVLKMD